jgi:hypothetical protein
VPGGIEHAGKLPAGTTASHDYYFFHLSISHSVIQ